MNPSVFCASYFAVTPIHCTVHLKETDVSLKGPKYHNLMEERLLQSRLNHLENQLRRTTLVTQRQQLHIQKTLNNIPKPSRNLDRRVAEAFRFIMAEEVYLNQKVNSVVNKTKSGNSCASSSTSSSSVSLKRPVSHGSFHRPISHSSSLSAMSDEQNRLLRVASAPHPVARQKEKPAMRFQRRVLMMEAASARSSKSSMNDGNNKSVKKTESKNLKSDKWKSAVIAATQKKVASQITLKKTENLTKLVSEQESCQQTSKESERWIKAWKTISYKRRKSDDVASKWRSLIGAVKSKEEQKYDLGFI